MAPARHIIEEDKNLGLLHGADIEIVSPNFMNTRNIDDDRAFIPAAATAEKSEESEQSTNAPVFGKAEEAESVARLQAKLAEAQDRLKACREQTGNDNDKPVTNAAAAEIEGLERKIEQLTTFIDRQEAEISRELRRSSQLKPLRSIIQTR